ncbi:PD40 domain-containing protein [Candidatus Dojkabacteria bacterium]|nr:PD40 domain-containing protein [Candidatus Dojkabacteria bacterium]
MNKKLILPIIITVSVLLLCMGVTILIVILLYFRGTFDNTLSNSNDVEISGKLLITGQHIDLNSSDTNGDDITTSYLYLIDLKDNSISIIPHDSKEVEGHTAPNSGSISPDGKKVAYIGWDTSYKTTTLIIYDIATQDKNTIDFNGNIDDYYPDTPVWIDNGEKVAFYEMFDPFDDTDDSLIIYNISSKVITKYPISQEYEYFGSLANFTFSPDGEYFVYEGMTGDFFQIISVETDTMEYSNLTNHDSNNTQPRWSADGESIVFVSDRDGKDQIYTMNKDGSNVTKVSQSHSTEIYPTWSPDGNQILFCSPRKTLLPFTAQSQTTLDILVMDTDGKNRAVINDGQLSNLYCSGKMDWVE